MHDKALRMHHRGLHKETKRKTKELSAFQATDSTTVICITACTGDVAEWCADCGKDASIGGLVVSYAYSSTQKRERHITRAVGGRLCGESTRVDGWWQAVVVRSSISPVRFYPCLCLCVHLESPGTVSNLVLLSGKFYRVNFNL